MTREKNTPTDYEIGRGKPPKKSQFVKGKSGNPGGRRKGSPNLATILKSVTESEIRLAEGGRTRMVPMMEAIALKMAQLSLSGNMRAIEKCFELYAKYVEPQSAAENNLSEDDEVLLARMLTRIQAARSREAPCEAEVVKETTDE